jgi:Trk-type K+ transport system membrane component
MDLQDLSYALVQVVHNFGAASVVAAPLVALRFAKHQPENRRRLSWIVLFGWVAQGASGIGFGAVSYYNYAKFPDIHGIATVALVIKVVCAISALLLVLALLAKGSNWSEKAQHRAWHSLAGFGTIAITAAAFLRWFS